jgi:prophage tail gpP-like protein
VFGLAKDVNRDGNGKIDRDFFSFVTSEVQRIKKQPFFACRFENYGCPKKKKIEVQKKERGNFVGKAGKKKKTKKTKKKKERKKNPKRGQKKN